MPWGNIYIITFLLCNCKIQKINKKNIFRAKNEGVGHYFFVQGAILRKFAGNISCYMKFILVFLGILSLVLGVVGVFLPVLPTTPFLLLSATLFMRSSRRLYDWLLAHPYLGEYIRNFKEHKAIPMRVKIVSVSLVWITLLYCAFFVAHKWWMGAVFIAIALGVSIHILSYRTLRK